MYDDIQSYYKFHSFVYDLTRWAFLFGRSGLREYLPELPPAPDILDLGCGTGHHLPVLNQAYPRASITAVDQSPHMIRKARAKFPEGVNFILGRYSEELFRDASFDLIICSYSLTMMDDPGKQLEVLQKHLRPEGMLLVLDFDQSRFPWFNKWMSKNFVSMSDDLFNRLQRSFIPEAAYRKPAYLGLWDYSLFLGRPEAKAQAGAVSCSLY